MSLLDYSMGAREQKYLLVYMQTLCFVLLETNDLLILSLEIMEKRVRDIKRYKERQEKKNIPKF